MQVSPDIHIQDALAQAQAGERDDYVTYEEDGNVYVAHRDDLEKMSRMGLGDRPLACIAISKDSPLLATERSELSEKQDYSRRLSEYFPVYFVAALYELQSLISRYELKGYVIGGITRDLLLSKTRKLDVMDVDITVEGDGVALANYLQENSRNFTVLEEFPEFGTAKLQYKDSLLFDVASTRQEIYPHCGALPVVVNRGVPLVDDVIRRDFTANALALSIHDLGQVLDYSNGIRDINNREIRVLHPVSFFEDPSRILRALKFCARFDFHLAPETLRLLTHFLQCHPKQYKGGGDRIKQELKGFLSTPESKAKSERIAFFMECGAWRLLNMETTWEPTAELVQHLRDAAPLIEKLQANFSTYTDNDFIFDTYLCLLLGDMSDEEFQATAKRLGLTRNERETVEEFRVLHSGGHSRFATLHEFSSPVEIYDLFNDLPLVSIAASLVDVGLNDPALFKNAQEAFLKYKRKWEKLSLELCGTDLIELGVPEGKAIGKLLDDMLHAKLAGQLPDRIDEIDYVRTHLGLKVKEADSIEPAPDSLR